MNVQHKHVVKLENGQKGLYVTFGESDGERQSSATILMRDREAESAALERLLAELKAH